MFVLHQDTHFHFEAMRLLGTAPYQGADIMEVLEVLGNIPPGDFDSWHDQFSALAKRVLSTVEESREFAYSAATLRAVYFRAAHYFFVSDFYLHGNPSDPRGKVAYTAWKKYFNKANALLPIPGRRITIKTIHGFDVPAMIFRAYSASASRRRPTLLISGGFESVMEETFHMIGLAALDRGYNVILYEGPGHRTLLEQQGKGFIAEWEQAVNPLVDYIVANKDGDMAFVDVRKIGLVGLSMGGYLAARAAAFEPRLAAVMCIDGVYDVADAFLSDPELREVFKTGNKQAFDQVFAQATGDAATTTLRWFQGTLKFTFRRDSAFECYKIAEKMTLANGIAETIHMPAFIADAPAEQFFPGQPARVVEAIGRNATLKVFEPEQAAHLHCHCGAYVYCNQEVLEWFSKVVES